MASALSRLGRHVPCPAHGGKDGFRLFRDTDETGGGIRLFAPGPVIGVAEGMETALAVRMRTGMPVWSAASASLLARLEPPPETSLVVVWADRDRSGAGEEAAMTLRERLQRQGISVAMHLPPGPIPARAKGIDWADVWCNRTERAVA